MINKKVTIAIAAALAAVSLMGCSNTENGVYNDGKPGKWSEKLYHRLRAIQYAEEPDTYGWMAAL